MPKEKDLKRLIRARMEKTGESYTAARAQIVATDESATPSQLPDDYEKVAGMSDAAVLKASGKTWPEWAAFLDAAGAAAWEHRAIVAYVYASDDDLSGWWSQMITVAYERFRGLRDYGQRRGGGYDVNKSKTVAVPVEALFDAFADESLREAWLDDPELTFHRATRPKSMRGRRTDGTRVDVYFTAKGDAKSSVSVQHHGIPEKEDAEAMKAIWGQRLDRLKAELVRNV